MLEDRRLFKRISHDSRVRFSLVNDGNVHDIITKSINISGGGMRVDTHEKIESLQNVSIEMNVPGYGKPISARGEIIWINSGEKESDITAGIRFTDIDSYDRQIILEHVHFG